MEGIVEMFNISFLVRKVIWIIKYNFFVKKKLYLKKEKITKLLAKINLPDKVMGGIFKGMKYIDKSTGSSYYPKIFGSYESYLNEFILDGINERNKIYVIGCAEGYYACGIKFIKKNTEIYAFDINSNARSLCRKLADLNNLEINVEGNFNPADHDLNGVFVIMDVEGSEEAMLLNGNEALYSKAAILVEVHNNIFGYGNLTSRIIDAYELTHKIEMITHRDYGKIDVTILNELGLSCSDSLIISDELRAGCNDWLFMSPR